MNLMVLSTTTLMEGQNSVFYLLIAVILLNQELPSAVRWVHFELRGQHMQKIWVAFQEVCQIYNQAYLLCVCYTIPSLYFPCALRKLDSTYSTLLCVCLPRILYALYYAYETAYALYYAYACHAYYHFDSINISRVNYYIFSIL